MNIRRIAIAIATASTCLFSVATAQEAPSEDPASTPQTPVEAEVPQRTTEQRVVFLLSGYEYFPTRADLDAVASAAEISKLLRSMAEDSDRRPTQRLRAVDALGYYDDAATVEFLTKLATSTPKADLDRRKLRTAGLLRHHAITALAKSQGAEAAPTLGELLDEDDLQIQLTAIHALGKHGGKAGRAALTALGDRTDNAIIKRELQKWVK